MAEEQTQEKEMSFDEAKAEFAKGKREFGAMVYFDAESKKPSYLLKSLCGFFAILSLAVSSIAFFNGSWIIGLVALFIAFCAGFYNIVILTDFGADAFFADLAEKRLQDSLKKSQDTDSSTEKPLHFIGIDDFQQSKKGKDGIIRYNPMTLLIVRFGKDRLLLDEVRLDALNPNEYSAKTSEFLYKDIGEIIIDKKAFSRRFIIKVCGQVEIDIEIAHNQHESAEAAAKAIHQKMRENGGNGGGNSGESSKNADSTS